jgi:FkbM family methyltransferase
MKRLYLPILDNGQGDVKADFLDCFIRSFSGQEVQIVRISDSDPRRARNRAAASFLESECERMLFIDGDIGFTREHIDWLLEHDEPIVGGIYPIKSMDLRPCLCTLPGQQPVQAGGMLEVLWCGTGFLSIRRDVFEELKTEKNRYTTHGRPEWDFFQSGVVNNHYESEDLGFCRLARERIQLLHEGSIKYPIQRTPDRLLVCPASMKCDVDAIWAGEYQIDLDEHPKTVLDIGGNLGAFTRWANEQWPQAKIFAYEPHPENAAMFKINTKGLPVTLTEAALTSMGGPTINIIEGDYAGRHSTSMPVGEHFFPVPAVHPNTLPKADFVKVDTEGAELDILTHMDLSETKAVALEYHRKQDKHEITRLMEWNGFKKVYHLDCDADRGLMKFKRQTAK